MTLIITTRLDKLTFNADKIWDSNSDGIIYFTAQNIHGERRTLCGINITELLYFKYDL